MSASRAGWPGLINAYRDRIEIPDGAEVVTLHEGGTPLVHAKRLSAATGSDVWVKVEGANPTGSFKDRGMTVAMTYALASGLEGGDLRLDRQHLGLRRGVRGQGRV